MTTPTLLKPHREYLYESYHITEYLEPILHVNHSENFLLSFALARDQRAASPRKRRSPRTEAYTVPPCEKPYSKSTADNQVRLPSPSASNPRGVREDLDQALEAAGVDPYALGPLSSIVEACYVAAKSGAEKANLSVTLAIGESAFDPWKIYTYREAAVFLRLSSSSRISEIPESDLPRTRVGMLRGSLGILGADLVTYAKGLPPVDYAGLRESWLEQAHSPERAPAQKAIRGSGTAHRTGRKRAQ